MLRELTNLSIETDGRYATAAELNFLRQYLDSLDTRITAYQELRESQDKIIERVKKEKRKGIENSNGNSDELPDICIRDMRDMLRFSASAMLFNDLEHLRDVLLWYKTIVRAFGYDGCMDDNYHLLEDMVNIYLPPEKAGLMTPSLKLNQGLLA